MNIGLDARAFPYIVTVLAVALPWLYPFATGPSPSVMPTLFAWACIALLLGVVVRAATGPQQEKFAVATATAWLMAGTLSAALGLLQYFGLDAALAPWVNDARFGEAFANLRQRNQFATLTNIGLMALFYLAAQSRERPTIGGARGAVSLLIAVALAWGNAVSGSRTGMLELFVLAALLGVWKCWRRAQTRRLLAIVLLTYASAVLISPMMAGWNPLEHGIVGRLSRGDPACSSRLTLWANVLFLAYRHPWQGWGWGELDYAHFMTLYDGPVSVKSSATPTTCRCIWQSSWGCPWRC